MQIQLIIIIINMFAGGLRLFTTVQRLAAAGQAVSSWVVASRTQSCQMGLTPCHPPVLPTTGGGLGPGPSLPGTRLVVMGRQPTGLGRGIMTDSECQ
jgi:hypothetical protein